MPSEDTKRGKTALDMIIERLNKRIAILEKKRDQIQKRIDRQSTMMKTDAVPPKVSTSTTPEDYDG